MKTLCLLQTYSDRSWISDYLNKKSSDETVVVIAPTVEAEILSLELGLVYKNYNDIAWQLDIKELYDLSRRQAIKWFQMSDIKSDSEINKIKYYKTYPLFLISNYNLMLSFYEINQSFVFINQVIKQEKPDRIVIGNRVDPFCAGNSRMYILIGSKGVEREAAKVIAKNDNIELLELPFIQKEGEKSMMEIFLKKAATLIKNPKLILLKTRNVFIKHLDGNGVDKSNFKEFKRKIYWEGENKKLLFFINGGYYLKQLIKILDSLILRGMQIIVIITGGKLDEDDISFFSRNSIKYFFINNLILNSALKIKKTWNNYTKKAFNRMTKSQDLFKLFSFDGKSYFKNLVENAIKKEIITNSENSVIELEKSEMIINYLRPDFGFVHFAVGSDEVVNVLPFKVKGIPTLTMSHGFEKLIGAARDSFATDYYALSGISLKNILIKKMNFSSDVLFTVGDPRLESVIDDFDKEEMKVKFGFDPNKPLCLFAENSGWTMSLTYRHSTFHILQNIIKLAKNNPDWQIIYRVHHGTSIEVIRGYVDKLSLSNLFLQVSPSPIFMEIVKCADIVISHASSSILESLILGVPVIYLTAESIVDEQLIKNEIVIRVDNFEDLQKNIFSLLENLPSRDYVIKKAKPLFDELLSGNDGMASKRVVDIIENLLHTKVNNQDFFDWEKRIINSSYFKYAQE